MWFYSDFLVFRIFFPSALALLNVREVESLRYVPMVAKLLDFNKLWQKKQKNDLHGLPVHDCTQTKSQNGSP